MDHPGTLILIMAVAVLAPLLAHGLAGRVRVPLVIFEIVLGILIGPDVLGWAHSDEVIDVLADLGLSMLIFLAGYEIQFSGIRGDTLRRLVFAWVISLMAGLAIALALTGLDFPRSVIIGTALTSTALATVLPLAAERKPRPGPHASGIRRAHAARPPQRDERPIRTRPAQRGSHSTA